MNEFIKNWASHLGFVLVVWTVVGGFAVLITYFPVFGVISLMLVITLAYTALRAWDETHN